MSGAVRIEALYDQGTAKHQEDGFVVNPPFFSVVDAFSPPYVPDASALPRHGNEASKGEITRQLILEKLYSAHPSSALGAIILRANERIALFQNPSLIRTDLLAAACFVFVKIGKETIEIIQGGDCLAVWRYNSGEYGATKNQAYPHVSANLQTITALMEKNNDDRTKMWQEFLPILSSRRLRDINNPDIESGYAVLNGQPAIARCWQRLEIPRNRLELMILFSNGLLKPYDESVYEIRMARRIIRDYEYGRLSRLLERKRQEEKNKQGSHIDHEEVTAVALVF